MGAGASVALPEGKESFTAEELQGILGDAFDQAKFDEAATGGSVAVDRVKELVAVAAAAAAPAAEGEAAPTAEGEAAPAAEGEAAAAEGEEAAAPEPSPEELAAIEAQKKAEELAARANGEATIIYNMYNEKFPVTSNTMKASDIDEVERNHYSEL
uniref:Uncharacterized protein n=1 Tax=Phaeomonas parva TaxID=124430 RepID=A0A6U4HEL7_9STRA